MSDADLIDPFAFEPFNGGRGARLACSTVSARVSIPGSQATPFKRVLVTNGGSVSAFVCFGQDTVVADLNCLEILPGTTQPFSVPSVALSGLYMAGITEAGTTNIQVTAGRGF